MGLRMLFTVLVLISLFLNAEAADESWIHFGKLFGTNLELQIGRQNFEEKREWWWDEDLDSIRFYYSKKSYIKECLFYCMYS